MWICHTFPLISIDFIWIAPVKVEKSEMNRGKEGKTIPGCNPSYFTAELLKYQTETLHHALKLIWFPHHAQEFGRLGSVCRLPACRANLCVSFINEYFFNCLFIVWFVFSHAWCIIRGIPDSSSAQTEVCKQAVCWRRFQKMNPVFWGLQTFGADW